MRQRAENELDRTEVSVIRRDERHVAPAQSDGRATLVVRRCKDERQLRMTRDECAELAACISASPEHTD